LERICLKYDLYRYTNTKSLSFPKRNWEATEFIDNGRKRVLWILSFCPLLGICVKRYLSAAPSTLLYLYAERGEER
jgi:hypothetical protein